MFRLDIKGTGCVAPEKYRENAEAVKKLGIPIVQYRIRHHTPLAVVGGGPSVLDSLEELRNWKGDIWAINGACQFLRKQGIASTLFSVDPDPCLCGLLEGVESAILASTVDPKVWEILNGKNVHAFHTEHSGEPHGIIGGTTSACRTQVVGLLMGYYPISYFGCEGNFTKDSHAYKHDVSDAQVLIKAGDKTYRTSVQFMAQAENLSYLIRRFPDVFIDRSGGLLSAMIEHEDTWEVVAFSRQLKNVLDPTATPYTGAIP